MRIDVHAHFWTEEYLDLLMALGKPYAGAAGDLGAGDGAELQARLRLMDRAGIEIQVLSASPQLPYAEDGERAAKAARFVNDQYAERVEHYPDRFAPSPRCPMPHIEESPGEMRRALDEVRLAGVVTNTSVLSGARWIGRDYRLLDLPAPRSDGPTADRPIADRITAAPSLGQSRRGGCSRRRRPCDEAGVSHGMDQRTV